MSGRRVMLAVGGGLAGACAAVLTATKGSSRHGAAWQHSHSRLPVVHASTAPITEEGQSRAETSDALKLIQVQVFFRHGARTPLSVLEGIEEPIYDKSFIGMPVPHTQVPHTVVNLSDGGPKPRSRMDEQQLSTVFKGGMPAGQMTALGRQQLFVLGKQLREKYIENLQLVPDKFSEGNIYVRSTNLLRTIASLECVLAGLFGAEHFSDKEPVTIPVMHMYHENLYPNFNNCDVLKQMRSTYIEQLMAIPFFVETVRKVQAGLGNDESTYMEMMRIRDHLVSMKAHGLNMPKWLDELSDDVEKAAAMSIRQYVTGGPRYRHLSLRLIAGPMYNIVEQNMTKAVNECSSAQKMYLYSCHDTSVFPLLMILGKHTESWPPYAADVRFELYKDDKGDHWVKALFCGEDVVPKGFSKSLLSLAEFKEMIEPYVVTPEQYKSHCGDQTIINELKEFFDDVKSKADTKSSSTPSPV